MQVCPPPCRANHFSDDCKDMLKAAAKSLEPERAIKLRVPEKLAPQLLVPEEDSDVSDEDSDSEGSFGHPPAGPSDGEDEDYSGV